MTIMLALLAALTPEARDSLLADTPGNSAFWSEVLSSSRGGVLECVEHLFSTVPRLDRLEMTSEVLMDHVIGAIDSRDDWYDSIPDDVFLSSLLEYRMDEEPVSAYRTPLMIHWTARLADADTTVVLAAERLAWAVSSMRVRGADFMGGVPAPRDILASGGGTPVELRVLLGCSLRALGIPVRPARGWFGGGQGRETGWTEYWDGGGWVPLPLPSDSIPQDWAGAALVMAGGEDVTSSYARTGTVLFLPLADSLSSALVAVSVPARGRLIPLDWLELDPYSESEAELGEGDYFVHLSSRRPSGAVDFRTQQIIVSAGEVSVADLESLAGTPTGGRNP